MLGDLESAWTVGVKRPATDKGRFIGHKFRVVGIVPRHLRHPNGAVF